MGIRAGGGCRGDDGFRGAEPGIRSSESGHLLGNVRGVRAGRAEGAGALTRIGRRRPEPLASDAPQEQPRPREKGPPVVDFRFGPVELYLVSLDGDRPAPAVIAALTDLVAAGTVNLLDFVVVSKAEDGTVTAIEIEEHADEYGAADLEFAALSVTGQEDIDEFAELIEPGTSAAVAALELAWAARLSSAVQASSAFPPRSSTRSSTPSTTKDSDMIRRVGRPASSGSPPAPPSSPARPAPSAAGWPPASSAGRRRSTSRSSTRPPSSRRRSTPPHSRPSRPSRRTQRRPRRPLPLRLRLAGGRRRGTAETGRAEGCRCARRRGVRRREGQAARLSP